MNTLADIGETLVRARRSCGMSQKELARLVGVHQQQIARWEATSYAHASLYRVSEVARALGFSSNTLLAYESPSAYLTAPTADVAVPVRDLGEAASRIRALEDELQRCGIERVGVFGSFARGTQTSSSDVDLLIHTTDPGGMRFIALSNLIEDALHRHVDVVRPHLLRSPLREQVLKEVVYVWEAR